MKIMVVSAISREDSSCYILAEKLCEMARGSGRRGRLHAPGRSDLPVNDGTLAWDDPRSVAWQQRVGGDGGPHVGVARVPQRHDRVA